MFFKETLDFRPVFTIRLKPRVEVVDVRNRRKSYKQINSLLKVFGHQTCAYKHLSCALGMAYVGQLLLLCFI